MRAKLYIHAFPSWLLCVFLFTAALRPASAEIFIGQVTPLSGSEANQGRAYALGFQMVLNQVNSAGGIGGQLLTLVSRNEDSQNSKDQAATRQLLTDQRPIALTGYFGAANVSSLLSSDLLAQEKIALVGYRGVDIPQSQAYVYSVRAGLRAQIDKIVQHLATLGIQRVGLILDEGPRADSLATVFLQTAGRQGMTPSFAKLKATTGALEGAVRQMITAKTQAVIVHAETASVSFIEAYRVAGGGAQLIATADIDLERLGQRLGETELIGISIAQVTPNPARPTIRLTREFLQTHAADSQYSSGRLIPLDQRLAQRPVSHAMFEGYLAGKILVEALKRSGRNPTRQTVVHALDTIDRLDLGDYIISYQPDNHQGSRYVELSIISSTGKLKQ
jgi:branched-chain amino acid transport system substrate-binding protein